ncbi:hypothetical protein COL154_013513 [Colletotrichum chrysophilum]|nr:hypothetical protein KNSL1_013656 [Colletotrichum chrysophilum]KAJ0349710.1 hypothetical protein COL154_013513 [Colletotrichum chrysophilum]
MCYSGLEMGDRSLQLRYVFMATPVCERGNGPVRIWGKHNVVLVLKLIFILIFMLVSGINLAIAYDLDIAFNLLVFVSAPVHMAIP